MYRAIDDSEIATIILRDIKKDKDRNRRIDNIKNALRLSDDDFDRAFDSFSVRVERDGTVDIKERFYRAMEDNVPVSRLSLIGKEEF